MGFQTGQDEDRPYSCCVYLNEMRCHPGDYREDVVDGFRRAYRFLLNRREELLADGGAFAAFRQVQIRTIFQNTSVYDGLIKKTLHPKFLRNGVDRSVLLEFLLRPLGRSDKQVAFWPRMKAEMAMVDVMDVPYFFTQADSTAIR
jgi:lantibiotic modifying enzyme